MYQSTLQANDVYEVLRSMKIAADQIELLQSGRSGTDFLIDKKYTLRISGTKADKQAKHERVKSVSFVPEIHSSGYFDISGCKYYCLLIDYVQGNDLMHVIHSLSGEQKISIGKEIAGFLNELHSVSDDLYDIGHYVPTIPRYNGSWKNGHLAYINYMQNELSNMALTSKGTGVIAAAFDYMYANINALEHQSGPSLLHNDLHPENIIISGNGLAAIIDWECSQFGEPDFELSHLFHWCVNEVPNSSLELLLKSVADSLHITSKLPCIIKRLTIYQLEHELNQIIWNGKKQEDERCKRVKGWLNGDIEALFDKWKAEY